MPGDVWVNSEGQFNRVERIAESDYESLVQRFQNVVFGGRTFLLVKRALRSVLGGTIPDGVLLSLPSLTEWYFVEVELAEHDVDGHILPQLTKIANIQLTSSDVASLAPAIQAELRDATPSVSVDLSGLLELFKHSPGIVVVIDDSTPAVRAAVESLRAPIHLITATPYVNANSEFGLVVSNGLLPRGSFTLLGAPTSGGIFGQQMLPVIAGRSNLPDGGEVTLRRGDARAKGQVIESGGKTFLSVGHDDLLKVVGSSRSVNRLRLRPILSYQVYTCETE